MNVRGRVLGDLCETALGQCPRVALIMPEGGTGEAVKAQEESEK